MCVVAAGVGLTGCAVPRVDQDIESILGVYRHEVQKLKDEERAKASVGQIQPIPASFHPWWHEELKQDLFEGERQEASLDDIYVETLMYSSQIRVFTDLPLIRRTGIQEAKGEFDTRLFVEARYDRVNDPVGSTLTTGNPNDTRFREEQHSLETGLRKKIITGGEFEAVQQLSRTPRNNSRFFTPNPQGNAELRLRYTQPLLQGAGIAYNESTIKIAELDSEIAVQEFIRQAESHLVEVARAYWGLYMARTIYLQKQRMVRQTLDVVEELKDRSELDAESAQLARAQAAYANRRADLVRSELAIRNAQDRLKALVNSENMFQSTQAEFIPLDVPAVGGSQIQLMAAAAEALESRPEITQAFKQLRAAAYREDMARNEVLPVLNVFMEGYVAGLEGDSSYTEAWENQFEEGSPGYSLGFYAEYPLENQVGRARLKRRKLETRQQFNSVKTTIETVLLELKVSVREVNTALRDLQAKMESMEAAREELGQLSDRRALEVGSDLTASAFLTLLLDSQDRLARAEEEFARSLVTYNVSLINLERAKGTLLKYEDIGYREYKDPETGLPTIEMFKDTDGQADPNRVAMASAPAPVVQQEPDNDLEVKDPDQLEQELMQEEPELEYDPEDNKPALPLEDPTAGESTESDVEEIHSAKVEATPAPDTVFIEAETVKPVAGQEPPGELSEAKLANQITPITEEPEKNPPFGFFLLAGLLVITGAVLGIRKLS